MSFRAAAIRLAILSALTAASYGVWYAQTYVSPDAVRDALTASLGDRLHGVRVHVGSARMQVFGGVSVHDLRFTRDGDAEPFFAARRAVIFHDKEQINSGRLAIRKIELDGPELQLECDPAGTWNVAGLGGPERTDHAVPTFVATNATVTVVDRRPNAGRPVVLTGVTLTLLNDPLPVVKADVKGIVSIGGLNVPVAVSGSWNRVTGTAAATFDAPGIPLGPELAAALRPHTADGADAAARITGRIGLGGTLTYDPKAPLRYDITAAVTDGAYADARLPWPVSRAAVTVRIADGTVIIEKGTAKLGPATLDVTAATRPGVAKNLPAAGFEALDQIFDRLTLAVRDLPVDDALFAKLPARAEKFHKLFSPRGPCHVGFRFVRSPGGGWSRETELKPAGMTLMFDKFRYPLTDAAGAITATVTSAGRDDTRIDLTALASGQKIGVAGTVAGTGPDQAIDLKVSGTNVPIDDRLFDSLPGAKYPPALKKLRATGRGDFVCEIREPLNVNLTENRFRIAVYGGALCDRRFPYPLSDVAGTITGVVWTSDKSRPPYPAKPDVPMPDADRVELTDFTARHGPGKINLFGSNEPIAGSKDRAFKLNIWGEACPLDPDLRGALREIRLDAVWRTFAPEGSINFGVEVAITDRADPGENPTRAPGPVRPPLADPVAKLTGRVKATAPEFNPVTDLKLSLNFTGPTVTPDFFPYRLDKLAGRVRWDGEQVKVEHFSAAHAASTWGLEAAEVRLYPNGQIWANLGNLTVDRLRTDADFCAALPAKLKTAVEQLNLRGTAAAKVKWLVALTAADAPAPLPKTVTRGQSPDSVMPAGPDPDIFWNAELTLAGASLDTGLPWENVRGKVGCVGRYRNTHLGDLDGNIWFDAANLSGTPLEKLRARVTATEQTADPAKPGEFLAPALEFRTLAAIMHGGKLTGEARVVLDDPPRYRLALTAADVKLGDLARHHMGEDAKFAGTAQAKIELAAAADPVTGKVVLTGAGSADVVKGHMGNVKFVLPMLKLLKFQAPDQTMFTDLHAGFTVRGDRVFVDHLDLLGDAVSLGGGGEMTTGGDVVRLEFYTIWSQTLQRWLTTPLGDVTALLSEKLFRIEVVRGTDGKLKYEPKVLPAVTDPFRAVADRFKARAGVTARASSK